MDVLVVLVPPEDSRLAAPPLCFNETSNTIGDMQTASRPTDGWR